MEPKFEIKDVEWAKDLQRGFDEYTDSLFESLDSGEAIETYSGLPYCECSVCFSREVISYLTVHLIEGYKAGKVDLIDS